MQNDEVWMRLALQEARLAAAEGEIPVGAVLVRDGQEICRAHNLRENQHDPTAHAEILCMRRGAEKLGTWRLRGCTLYVTLEPCPRGRNGDEPAQRLRLRGGGCPAGVLRQRVRFAGGCGAIRR